MSVNGPQSVYSPHTEALLKAHRPQGSSNDCGPFTTAMVVEAVCKVPVEAPGLAKRMNRPRRRGLLPVIRRVPNWATFPWGVADVLREYGLAARWQLRARQEDLLPRLAAGDILLPVVGEWRPKPWAHISALVSWDAERGWGFADPAMSSPIIRWRSEEEFSRLWNAYFRLLVYVPAPQEDESSVSGS